MSQTAKMSDVKQLTSISRPPSIVTPAVRRTGLGSLRNLNNLINFSCYASYLTQAKFWPVSDVAFMQLALQLALQGANKEEVPVGAVLVHEGKIIGEGFNQPILSCDPTAHAEIVALRSACHHLENYRLPPNTTLYVTLEPCTMCLGALIHARLARLVFATQEPRAGMVGSQLNLTEMDFYNHKIKVDYGLLQPNSQQILKSFFKLRRKKRLK